MVEGERHDLVEAQMRRFQQGSPEVSEEQVAALFAAVIDEASADFAERMAKVKTCSGPAQPRLNSFLTAYADFISDPFVRAIFRLVMTERRRATPPG